MARSLGLAIGIEYIGASGRSGAVRLRGCHRDVAAFAEWLRAVAGVHKEDLCVLTDQSAAAPSGRPTKAAILGALRRAATTARADPAVRLVWVYYSGHGNVHHTPVRGMVPCDYDAVGVINHAELASALDGFPEYVTVVAIADACGAPNQLGLPPRMVFGLESGRLPRAMRRKISPPGKDNARRAKPRSGSKGPSSSTLAPTAAATAGMKRKREEELEEQQAVPLCKILAVGSCTSNERSLIYVNLPTAQGSASLFTWAFLQAATRPDLLEKGLPLVKLLEQTQLFIQHYTALQHVTLCALGAHSLDLIKLIQ